MLLRIYRAFLPPSDYGITIKSFHTKAVFDSKFLLSHNHVFHSASPQISLEEANFHRHYRTTLSQLRSYLICSSLHSYCERIRLIPSPVCPSCGMEPHITVHVFFCSSHPTTLTDIDLWERPRLALEFLFGLPFFDLFLFPLS